MSFTSSVDVTFFILAPSSLAQRHGARQEARNEAARALARTRQGDWLGAAMASRAMARLAHAEGRQAAALRHLAMADRAAAQRGAPHEHAANARCRAELGL